MKSRNIPFLTIPVKAWTHLFQMVPANPDSGFLCNEDFSLSFKSQALGFKLFILIEINVLERDM